MAVEWGKEVGRGRRGRTEVCSLGLRTDVTTPTTYRQLIPLGGYNQGQVASWHWRNDDGVLRYGKKADTQRRLRWKVMFCLFGWNDALPRNLFPRFTSLSLVFHSFWEHICLRDKGPFGPQLSVWALWGSTFSPMLQRNAIRNSPRTPEENTVM